MIWLNVFQNGSDELLGACERTPKRPHFGTFYRLHGGFLHVFSGKSSVWI
jgi:hypothetical protein